MSIRLLFIVLLSIGLFQANAQGTLSGTLTDESIGDVLIGANVVLEGTTIGSSSDLDGKYQFKVDPGTYTVVVSYIGYTDKKITDVVIKDGEVTYLDVSLSDGAVDLGLEVVVEAKIIERSENAVLLLQKKSDKIQDGISAQEMSRFGAGNAASAVKKISGATVQGGKYVYIRGLGDRYSSAQINGIQLPSTDPYRNSVQMDLIPSNMLDNIIVSKSFTPDQPGTFTGGNINLKTKTLPENRVLNFKVSFGYNTQSSLKDDFLTHKGGELDWLGYDDGTRKRPDILDLPSVKEVLVKSAPIRARKNKEKAEMINRAINTMHNDFAPEEKKSLLNHSLGFTYGDQFDLGIPVGVLFSGKYSRSFQHYNDGVTSNWILTDPSAEALQDNFVLSDTKSVENPELGGMLGLSFRLNPYNNIQLSTIYNHSTDILNRYQSGQHQANNITKPSVFETRVLHFLEREINNYQLLGDHAFLEGLFRIDWAANYVKAKQSEPDLKFFANSHNQEDNVYGIDVSLYELPSHFFRDLNDTQLEGKIDFTLNFLQNWSKANKLKFGAAYLNKDREFTENRYSVVNSKGSLYDGSADGFFSTENSGIISEENGSYKIGNFLVNGSRPQNNYGGTSKVGAAYAMTTLQLLPNLKFIGGVRVEKTDILVESEGKNLPDSLRIGEIDQLDFLPSSALTLELNESMNLRASYGRTLARPNMRELAPFFSFDFIGGAFLLGNPNLERTLVNNYDLRWEWFIGNGEIAAISGYYKDFTNPIIKSFNTASNPEFIFRNVDRAKVYGVELEFRKGLGFIGSGFENFKFGSNISFIKSTVDIPDSEYEIIKKYSDNPPTTRPFSGQSPFIVNANLGYNDGVWDTALAFNLFGDRLNTIGQEGTPDLFEKGRAQLDLSIKRSVGNIDFGFSAQNLLNPKYETFSTYKDKEFVYSEYKKGITLGLSITYNVK